VTDKIISILQIMHYVKPPQYTVYNCHTREYEIEHFAQQMVLLSLS